MSRLASADSSLYPDDIFFQHVLEGEEMVLGEARAIYQDSEGFMWLSGWDRLVKYDGHKFREVFFEFEEDGQTKRASTRQTTLLFEDSQGKLWLASASGLRWYDKTHDVIRPYTKYSGDGAEELSTLWVNDVVEYKPGEFILALGGAAVILDVKSGQFEAFWGDQGIANDPNMPGGVPVNAVLIDTKNRIWMGTDRGLDLFDYESQTFEHLFFDANDPLSAQNSVKDIVQAADGKLYLAGTNGIVLFDPDTKRRLKTYKHNPEDENSLGSNDIWRLLVDSKDRIWAAADQGGINLYNPAIDDFINYTNETGKKGSLASVSVRSVHEDSNGDIWLGLFPEGIDFFDQSSTAVTTMRKGPGARGLNFDSVLAIVEDERGNLWLGTDGGGLNFFNRETNTIEVFRHNPEDENSLASDAILSMLLDSKNQLWMGHWGGGVTKLDIKTKTFTRIPYRWASKDIAPYLSSPHVWSISEDAKGNVWLGTHTNALNKYNRETGLFHHYAVNGSDPDAIHSEWIWKTFISSNGDIWLGALNGLIKLDPENETFRQIDIYEGEEKLLVNSAVHDIYEDQYQRLWLGAIEGLYLFDPKEEKVLHVFGTEDGLNDETIRTIAGVYQDELWLGTSNGVSTINIETFEIKNYNRDNGVLVGPMNFHAGMITSRDEVVIGGINGLKFYKPEELKPNPRIPPIVFTELTLFSEPVTTDDKTGLLKTSINETEKIILDHTQTVIGVEFAALNFRDPGKNQYAFKLEGFDNKWNYVGNQRVAKYTNLDPGTYTLMVKASNNDGVWNEDARSLTIVQLPPPWQTWWAYTIYTVIFFGAIALLFYLQIRKRKNLEKLNQLLERTVDERTKALKSKNNDIQAMLSNIPQGLFTIKTDLTIHHEYSVFLEEIFETSDISGHMFSDFLFSQSNIEQETIDQIYETAQTILGEDEVNYDFNSHLFSQSFEIETQAGRKYLSVEWNPIIDNGRVARLMVSVRDLTSLKEAERENLIRKREIDIISELINISVRKFTRFEASTKKLLEECKHTINPSENVDSSDVALLFRNIHTIKGNSRTLGFTYLSKIAHEAEDIYANAQADRDIVLKPTKLLGDLERLEGAMHEYADVFRNVLSRDQNSHSASNDEIYSLDPSLLESIHKCLSLIQKSFGDDYVNKEFFLLRKAVDDANTSLFGDIVSDCIESLPSIAEQLGKNPPNVDIQGVSCRIDASYVELIQNIFPHLLRNAIDHGIENPEQRHSAGKSPTGNITITAEKSDNGYAISIADDGRGLNLRKLKALGVRAGKWSDDDTPSAKDIAELIFQPGVSTAESISDISGRGVGMDAVRQYIEDNAGTVKVIVLDDGDTNSDFVAIRTEIILPVIVRAKDASEPRISAPR